MPAPDLTPRYGVIPKSHESGVSADDIRRAQLGDSEAFERLYRAECGRVFAVCLRLSGNREHATVLMQDAFVRAWEKLASYRGDSAFSTWMHRLSVNVILNDRRMALRRGELNETDVDGDLSVISEQMVRDPGDGIDLERAIAALAPKSRVAFVLREIEGYEYEEIAKMMGVAAGTVRAHVFHARQQLMEVLDR
jgi:RNA polymerase sigma-70 factor (ECF subfamily)